VAVNFKQHFDLTRKLYKFLEHNRPRTAASSLHDFTKVYGYTGDSMPTLINLINCFLVHSIPIHEFHKNPPDTFFYEFSSWQTLQTDKRRWKQNLDRSGEL